MDINWCNHRNKRSRKYLSGRRTGLIRVENFLIQISYESPHRSMNSRTKIESDTHYPYRSNRKHTRSKIILYAPPTFILLVLLNRVRFVFRSLGLNCDLSFKKGTHIPTRDTNLTKTATKVPLNTKRKKSENHKRQLTLWRSHQLVIVRT